MPKVENFVSDIDFGDGINRQIKDKNGITSVSVNGVPQTVTNNSVNMDIASNLIPDTQWTQIIGMLV